MNSNTPHIPQDQGKIDKPKSTLHGRYIGGGLLVLALFLIAIFFITRFHFFQKKEEGKIYPGTITIGYSPWPGYIALFIARDKGYFADEDLDIELKAYPSLKEASEDYVQGIIQGKANLNLDSVNEAAAGLNHQAVLVIDYSNGSDGIIAKEGIKKIANLKNKKVAYEFDTLEEFFLRYALKEEGLSLEDIRSTNLNPEEAANAFAKGEVDVAVTYEPYMSAVLEKGKGEKIYSSVEADGLIVDVLTFQSDFIKNNPETISAILRAYFKAIDFLETTPEQAYVILAKEFQTTPEQIAEQLQGVRILTLNENKTAFTFSAGTQSLYFNFREIGKFIAENQEQKPVDTDELLNGSFIKTLTKTIEK